MGGLIFVVSSTLLVVGTSLWNYILGMILVGIAWNLSFSAGTVMLTKTYKASLSYLLLHIILVHLFIDIYYSMHYSLVY